MVGVVLHCSGVYSSVVLVQRRWHELKAAARASFAAYTRAQGPPPSALHTAIVKR